MDEAEGGEDGAAGGGEDDAAGGGADGAAGGVLGAGLLELPDVDPDRRRSIFFTFRRTSLPRPAFPASFAAATRRLRPPLAGWPRLAASPVPGGIGRPSPMVPVSVGLNPTSAGTEGGLGLRSRSGRKVTVSRIKAASAPILIARSRSTRIDFMER